MGLRPVALLRPKVLNKMVSPDFFYQLIGIPLVSVSCSCAMLTIFWAVRHPEKLCNLAITTGISKVGWRSNAFQLFAALGVGTLIYGGMAQCLYWVPIFFPVDPESFRGVRNPLALLFAATVTFQSVNWVHHYAITSVQDSNLQLRYSILEKAINGSKKDIAIQIDRIREKIATAKSETWYDQFQNQNYIEILKILEKLDSKIQSPGD